MVYLDLYRGFNKGPHEMLVNKDRAHRDEIDLGLRID